MESVPYPPEMTPDRAVDLAVEGLPWLRDGMRKTAVAEVVALYRAGRYVAAIEALGPMLRYNPGSGSAAITHRLYMRWRDTLLPETLEPFLSDWYDNATLSLDVDGKRRALATIPRLATLAEQLPAGKAPLGDPYSAWIKLMEGLGKADTHMLNPKLWPRARDLAIHIARTRLRNPNIAPASCLGAGRQVVGTDTRWP